MSCPDRPITRPIRRLRVVPNPAAPSPQAARLPAVRATGGRHRKPDTDELPLAAVDAATVDVVPSRR